MPLAISGLILALFGNVQAPPSTSNQAVAGAVLPLPAPLRGGATVVRLDASLQPEVLRKGSNGMVCIADRPNDDAFDVRCYRDTFIPVVYRAFQLGYQVPLPRPDRWLRRGAPVSRQPDRMLAVDSLSVPNRRRARPS